MKRKMQAMILALCVNASAVLAGIGAQREIVRADAAIKAASVSTAYGKSSVVTTDGRLYMWGSYSYGPANFIAKDKTRPLKIMDNVTQASMGYDSYGIIKTDGNLYMWGRNEEGQLGDGSGQNQELPVKVLDQVIHIDLGTGDNAACVGAVTKDGSLYMWGRSDEGLGNVSSRSGVPVKIMDNAVSVSLGSMHSGVLASDGGLYLWGSNSYHQMGEKAQLAGAVRPEKMLDEIASFSLGGFHSAAITKDGSLYVWGANDHGQSGNGTISDYVSKPIKVMDNVIQVSLSEKGSAAVTEDGSLYVWGANNYGQVGNNSKEDCPTPVKILDNIATVSIASTHGVAVAKDGSVYTWGRNNSGELGDGTRRESLTPKKIELTSASIDAEKQDQTSRPQEETISKVYTDQTGRYLVSGQTPEQCVYLGPADKKVTIVIIPATVTFGDHKYKVMSVADGAFENCEKLKSVKIGRNITQIGERAFYECGKLKTITIQSQKLKSVGKDCLLGISSKAVIKVSKAKLPEYKKLLMGKGQRAGVKITGV